MSQEFNVTAENTSVTPSPHVQFIVIANSHREAWRTAREVCRTGKGAKFRDLREGGLHEFPIEAGQLTVKRVLSLAKSRRGRPPKLWATDLTDLADQRQVKLSKRLKQVIDELQRAG